jgi:poly(hydroxyalkanoate) depolymerase family esterase
MRNPSSTINRMSKWRALQQPALYLPPSSKLKQFPGFGSNPGALQSYVYIPSTLLPKAPLVVVLHGCMQTADDYDQGSGWSDHAEKHGFAILYPEQTRSNNPNTCFNWFKPTDSRRGDGEPESIIQMITSMITAHDLDPHAVYVTGLSAGGAMTSILLAQYPDVFAGGAIIAGLPFGAAANVPEAFAAMNGAGRQTSSAIKVDSRIFYQSGWPTLSVWHGEEDDIVNPSNSDAIIGQWLAARGLSQDSVKNSTANGFSRRYWVDADGQEFLESWRIPGMGHGTPRDGDDAGNSGPYMLDAGISSTRHIAKFWYKERA